MISLSGDSINPGFPISLFISSLFRVIFVSSAASLHRAAEAV